MWWRLLSTLIKRALVVKAALRSRIVRAKKDPDLSREVVVKPLCFGQSQRQG